MQKIAQIRKKIDTIDQKLNNLLLKRANQVAKLKKLKKTANLPILDKEREKQILAKFDSNYVKRIFKTILSASKTLQKSPNQPLKK